MKEKISTKSKESKKPTRSDSKDKEKVKVLRKKKDKESRESFSHGAASPSLEEQFQEIVENAQARVICEKIRSQIKGSQSPKHQVDSQPQVKEVKLELKDCCSPARQTLFRDKECDGAPSPITPPLPKRIRLAIKEDEDAAPSPEGMGPLPQSLNLNQGKQALPAEDQLEPMEDEEVTFFDAHDTSIIECGSELNLDGLIDEIFINQTNNSGPAEKEEDPLTCTSPERCSEVPQTDVAKEGVPLENSPAVVTNSVSVHPAPQNDANEVLSEICNDTPTTGTSQEDSGIKNKKLEGNLEKMDNSSQKSSVATALSLANTVANKNADNVPVLPILNISDGMGDTSSDSIIEVFLNEEGFNDDLSLTDSQILDIDAKCKLLKESSQNLIDPLAKDPQIEEVHKSNSSEVKLASTETPTSTLPKPVPNLGFSVPPVPQLNWVQKALDSRQRLRSITQEISRLNAMVLRARRMIWPRQQQDMEQQHAGPSSTGSSRLPAATLPLRSQPSQVSDPEWNLS